MKILIDFFPVVIFFITYKFAGIYPATVSAVGAALLQNLYQFWRYKKWDGMQLFTLVLLIVLGGATLFFHNDIFIKWKPSVINWFLAIVFLWTDVFCALPLIQRLMQEHISLPSPIWQRLNRLWVGFFTLMGFVNLYVVYHYSTDVWVNFKLFGMLGLTIIFVMLQSFYLAKHIKLS